MRLSVIIPIGPGDQSWRGLLPQLEALPQNTELRLIACRSEDLPAADLLRHSKHATLTLVTECGRARQLNAGVRASSGEHLWFLHADTRLHTGSIAALLRSIDRYPDTLGWFDLRFLDDGPGSMRINEVGVWWRSHLLRLPFGDQGLFLSRANFARLGGFDESLPSAEDHALVWAARRAGIRLRCAGARLYTSARRYAEQGWRQTTGRHLRLTWEQARAFSRGRLR